MPYDGKILSRARDELERQREINRAEHQRRLNTVYRRIPEVEEIDTELRRHMAELVRLTVSRRPDIRERIAELKDANLSAQQRKAELMTAAGFDEHYLDEICSCPKCSDTGIYEGRVCSCLDRLYNAELTKELGTLMHRGDECFERFDLRLYSDRFDPDTGVAPRELMATVFDICKRFAENFSASSPNLLMQGGTGLGKTYLSACIARVVAGKGFSVCYDSASSALENYEKAKFSRDSDEGEAAAVRVRRMQDCDLMILDDLGTEMLTQMSQSALYTLINFRLVNGKKTVISTNLTPEELTQRYSAQISSRILGEFVRLPFCGQDIRLNKKPGAER